MTTHRALTLKPLQIQTPSSPFPALPTSCRRAQPMCQSAHLSPPCHDALQAKPSRCPGLAWQGLLGPEGHARLPRKLLKIYRSTPTLMPPCPLANPPPQAKNNTIPWFELAEGSWGLRDPASLPGNATVWMTPGAAGGRKLPERFFGKSEGQVADDLKIGFLANELLDAGVCSGARNCPGDVCAGQWPFAYVVHHCMSTWWGRIDKE